MALDVDPKLSKRVRELLIDAMDSDACEAALDELNELLRSENEPLRRDAVRFLADDCCLTAEITTIEKASALAASWEMAGDDGRSGDLDAASSTKVDLSRRRSEQRGPRPARSGLGRVARAINENGIFVAAACLILALGAGWHYSRMRLEVNRLHSLAAAPDPFSLPGVRAATDAERGRTAVARVTGVIDCEWAGEQSELKFGDTLVAGQGVSLRSGVLQLTLSSGARVLVEGPADFVATSASETELSAGRIAAAVPRSGRGYTVLTPTAEIVDLGTEFGVHVDPMGASSVHVFDGEVVARARGESGVGEHATAGEAFRFAEPAAAPAKINQGIANDFVRRVGPSADWAKLPELPVTEGLALWLAADQIPGVGDGEAVASWPDLLVGDNKFADDAMQFDESRRPKLKRDSFDRPVVSFDGWSTSLVTAPAAITTCQTSFAVVAPGPTSYAKHPNGGVVLRTGPLALAVRKNRKPIGWLWAGDNSKPAHVGVAKGDSIPKLEPSVICYEYNAADGQARMYVNGRLQATSSADKPLPRSSQRFVGRSDEVWQKQYFLGNLYEVVVYESPLTEEQKQRVARYLADRHEAPMSR